MKWFSAHSRWLLPIVWALQLGLVLGMSQFEPVELPITMMLMQLTVVAIALFGRVWLSVVAAVSGALLINWFLIPPVRTFHVQEPRSLAALMVFAVVGIVIALLLTEVRQQRSRSQEMEAVSNLLSDQRTALERETESLRDRDIARKWLLASASHELRTPLSTIRIALEELRSGSMPTDLADTGLEAADRLESLVDNLLDLSRIEAGVLTLSPSEVSLQSVTKDVLAQLPAPRVQLNMPDQPLLVMSDEVLLQRVIANLINNALRHSPINQPVVVTGMQAIDRISFAISDRGSGTADVVLANMRGQRTAGIGDRSRSSSGLGLLLVRELSHHLGIEFSVEDTPGGGVTAVLEWRNSGPTTR